MQELFESIIVVAFAWHSMPSSDLLLGKALHEFNPLNLDIEQM